ELDGGQALGLVDLEDREEVGQALRVALKIPHAGAETFDRLFPVFWSGAIPGTRESRPHLAPEAPRGGSLRWDPDRRLLVTAGAGGASDGDQAGYSPEALLRQRPF